MRWQPKEDCVLTMKLTEALENTKVFIPSPLASLMVPEAPSVHSGIPTRGGEGSVSVVFVSHKLDLGIVVKKNEFMMDNMSKQGKIT